MWRYAWFQRFEFGAQRPAKNRKGEAITMSDWTLVAGCYWRITGPDGEKVVSSADFGPGESRRDEKAYPFYGMLHREPLVVEAVEADERGELRIRLSQGYLLKVSPDDEPQPDPRQSDYEQWLFLPRDGRRRRFDFSAEGLSWR